MTPQQGNTIEKLSLPASDKDIQELAVLLVETVASGAAVSFLATLTVDEAVAWWRQTLATASRGAIVLVAREGDQMIGTVQMHPSWAPNQPHRAEIAKMMVHTRFRGRGLGTLLMQAIETAARQAGYRLLTLDTKAGSTAEHLYRRLDWSYVGTIPDFAFDPDGITPHDDVIFFKDLRVPPPVA